MVISLLALAFARKAITPLPIPIGTRTEFQTLAYSIESALAKGDNATAAKLGEQLPKPMITIGWDEGSIPLSLRPNVDGALQAMIGVWRSHIRDIDFTTAPSGDLNFTFSKDIKKDSEGLPEESILEFGSNPRLKVTVGLLRGNPPQSIIPGDAYMEIGHAIGAYLGIADDALAGNCMYRDNHPGLHVYGPSRSNYVLASLILKLSDQLRELIKSQKPVEVKMPHLSLTSPKTDVGTIRQGMQVPFDFVVKNTGDAPLAYNLVPDCGCFKKPPGGLLQPGQETTVRTVMDTSEYIGKKDKMLVLYSNDPADPVHQIPVSFLATPICRLYRPEGDTVSLPAPNNSADILMTIPDGSTIVPEQFEWTGGVPGKISMEKWSGMAPDPDLNEPPKMRRGYIFHLKFGKNQIDGRPSGTLNITTNDDEFPTLRYTLYVQKGILAEPSELFFGSVGSVARNNFELTWPGRPFKILSIKAGSKSLKTVIYPISSSSYRIDVTMDPTLTSHGDFESYLSVLTTVSSQPITIPVTGTVQ